MIQPLLRAFRHPFILLSIAVLLLNDHVLKVLTPSWATGKISDFAGLFFFPFLIGVLLQACRPKSVPSQKALLAGFILTAAVFTGLKTWPIANQWATLLLSNFYRQPIHIALDATDCMALIVFLPAWKMWRNIEQQKEKVGFGTIPYLALAVGSLAALATSPCATTPQVTRLAYDGGTLYAGIGITNRIEDGGIIMASQNGWENWRVVMVSEYSGTSWKAVPNYEALVANNPFRLPRKLPFTLCDPLEPTTCYRIDGSAQVEQSLDGGASWTTAWLPLPNREDFRDRLAGGVLINCGKVPDLRTFDLVFYPGQKGSTLLVAMGNEGLLVHTPPGGWQAVGMNSTANEIYSITPTPFTARNPGEAFSTTTTEFLLAAAAGLLAWSILSIWMRRKIFHRIGITHTGKKIFVPAVIAGAMTLLIPAALLYLTPRNSILLVSTLSIPFWVVMAIVALWHFATFPADIPAQLRRIDRSVFLCGLLVFVAAWLPMALWAFGVIEAYTPALILSIGSGLAALAAGIFWLNRQVNAY